MSWHELRGDEDDVSERLFARLPENGVKTRSASLALKGKREEEPARVIDLAGALAHEPG